MFLVECCWSRGLLFPLIVHNDTHSVSLAWTRDQSVAEASVCLTHNIHKRKMSVSRAGYETGNSANEGLQTHVLERDATAIGRHN